MANPELLTNVSGALSTTMSAQIKRQWNRLAVTAASLPAAFAVGQGGGKQITWDVEFSGAGADTAAEGSDIQSGEFLTDPVQAASLSYGYYRTAFALSNTEINAAAASVANATALGNLVTERMYGSAAKLISKINSDLWTGTGTGTGGNPTIIGFLGATTGAILDTGTYAGIDKGVKTEWASSIIANGGNARPLTMDLLLNGEQLIYVGTGLPVNWIKCSPGVFRKYAGLFESRVRTDAGANGNTRSYNGSFDGDELFWKGVKVVRDKDMPTGTLTMGNDGEAMIKVLPATNVGLSGELMGSPFALPSSNGEMANPSGLVAAVYPLGRTGSAVKFFAEIHIQLQVTRPKAFATIQDISEV